MTPQNGRVTVHLQFDQHKSEAEGTVIKVNTHSITIKVTLDTIIVFDAKTGIAENANHWVNPLEAQRAYQASIDAKVNSAARAKSGKKKPGTIVYN